MMRARTSSELPAGAATTNLIGLSGQLCADAWSGAIDSAAHAASNRQILRNDIGIPRLSRRVADRLDVVPIGVQNKGAIVVGMVLRARSRSSVVPAACSHRRPIERVDLCARFGAKRDVDGRHVRLALTDPEVRLGRDAEAGELF